eukprot:tig00000737_g3807.t1
MGFGSWWKSAQHKAGWRRDSFEALESEQCSCSCRLQDGAVNLRDWILGRFDKTTDEQDADAFKLFRKAQHFKDPCILLWAAILDGISDAFRRELLGVNKLLKERSRGSRSTCHPSDQCIDSCSVQSRLSGSWCPLELSVPALTRTPLHDRIRVFGAVGGVVAERHGVPAAEFRRLGSLLAEEAALAPPCSLNVHVGPELSAAASKARARAAEHWLESPRLRRAYRSMQCGIVCPQQDGSKSLRERSQTLAGQLSSALLEEDIEDPANPDFDEQLQQAMLSIRNTFYGSYREQAAVAMNHFVRGLRSIEESTCTDDGPQSMGKVARGAAEIANAFRADPSFLCCRRELANMYHPALRVHVMAQLLRYLGTEGGSGDGDALLAVLRLSLCRDVVFPFSFRWTRRLLSLAAALFPRDVDPHIDFLIATADVEATSDPFPIADALADRSKSKLRSEPKRAGGSDATFIPAAPFAIGASLESVLKDSSAPPLLRRHAAALRIITHPISVDVKLKLDELEDIIVLLCAYIATSKADDPYFAAVCHRARRFEFELITFALGLGSLANSAEYCSLIWMAPRSTKEIFLGEFYPNMMPCVRPQAGLAPNAQPAPPGHDHEVNRKCFYLISKDQARRSLMIGICDQQTVRNLRDTISTLESAVKNHPDTARMDLCSRVLLSRAFLSRGILLSDLSCL